MTHETIEDKTTLDEGQKNSFIEVHPARKDPGAESIHQRSACPMPPPRPASPDTAAAAAATNRETNCFLFMCFLILLTPNSFHIALVTQHLPATKPRNDYG